jgi:hypothetical protein
MPVDVNEVCRSIKDVCQVYSLGWLMIIAVKETRREARSDAEYLKGN